MHTGIANKRSTISTLT